MPPLLALVLAISAIAAAQINTGEIGGVVRDSSGAVLPGATVIATHADTGLVVDRVTDGDGRFFLPALRIGAWTVEARLAGLSPQTRKIVLEVGRAFSLDFTLSSRISMNWMAVRQTTQEGSATGKSDAR